ncbi:NAD(P)H-dependent oxidoreductase subunit E [bacterium]|nr:NAD(P)H-dependent oxidoreductase subunit E [bacterium]
MSPKSKTGKRRDPGDVAALEPTAGDTGAKVPASPSKATGDSCDPMDPVCICDTMDEIFTHYPREEASLIMILQELQDRFNWLPDAALERIAEELDIPKSRILAVSTFYKSFSLDPRGRKVIKVCTGTACHVRGAGMLLEEFERVLDIPVGEGMTDDGTFSLESVNCVGACAMAPAVLVNDRYYAKVGPGNLGKLLTKERES